LFNYDSPKVGPSDNLLLHAISAEIREQATVRITGYTDSLGDESHNRELANMRAQETAKIIRKLVPRGVDVEVNQQGGERERFPYDTPEGRSHCRTVIIEVRTPTSAKGS
jgi:outer membrane protein OmpA-like peptidoglycan-associated protein